MFTPSSFKKHWFCTFSENFQNPTTPQGTGVGDGGDKGEVGLA